MGPKRKIENLLGRLGPDETRRHVLVIIGFILREFKLPFVVIPKIIRIFKSARFSKEGWYYISIAFIRKEIAFLTVKCVKGLQIRRDSLCRIINYMRTRKIATVIKNGVKRSISFLVIHPEIVRYFMDRMDDVEKFLNDYWRGDTFISEDDAKAEFIKIFLD